MKQLFVFVLLTLALASCSTFSRAKYGHIHKVPAVPVEYSSSSYSTIEKAEPRISADTAERVATQLTDSLAKEAIAVQPEDDVALKNAVASPVQLCSPKNRLQKTELQLPLPLKTELQLPLQLKTDLPPDLQLFFALIFIIAAILVLLLCIFVIPYMVGWLWIVLAELVMLYAAWKLIATAIAFLRGKFGSGKSYEEH